MKNKKAQIAVEWIIITAILLMVFVGMFAIVDKRNFEARGSSKYLYAKQTADDYASRINAAYLAGDGASLTYIIPAAFRDGTEFNITVRPNNRLVEIRWMSGDEVRSYTSTITTGAIIGNLTNSGGNVTLTNTDDEISLTIV